MSTPDDSGWGRSSGSGQGHTPSAPDTREPTGQSPSIPEAGGGGIVPSSDEPSAAGKRPADRLPQQRPPEGPPDLDEFWQELNNRVQRLLGRRQGSGGQGGHGRRPPVPAGRTMVVMAVLGIVVVALLWLLSGFYIVQEGQAAAVLRFGQFRYLTHEAGIQWNLPYPIETHEIIDRSRLRQIEVGYRHSVRAKVPAESLILTGDQSIVDLQYAVQYRIDNPGDFLFQNNLVSGSEALIRQVAESAMREIVGQRTTDQVLYEDKAQVAEDAQKLSQAILDRYKLGIGIVDFTIQQAQPPEQVQAAFEDANKADQDRQRLINEGQAYANDVIPRARGEAARIVLQAQGYRARVTAQAEGDAQRFEQIHEQYARAPQVTRERMYLETMQQVLSSTSKVYLDTQKNGSLVYLPLERLLGNPPSRKPQAPGPATLHGERADKAVEQAPVSVQTPQPANGGGAADLSGRGSGLDALRSRERGHAR
ncbi:MAG: FtsH protease activity modulator HflK [Lautropia sp.]|nr:FtsH protease activity modulator HflK [Lautropia sp.]